jgi:hypothetical protein
MKYKIVKWAGHGNVLRRDPEMHTVFWVEDLEGRGYFEDIGIADRIILTF